MSRNLSFWTKLGLVCLVTLSLWFARQITDRLLDRPPVNERLIDAAADGDDKEVDLALYNGASPLAKDAAGRTALCFAAQHGDVRIARRLLDAGANINDVDRFGMTALMWAINSRSLAMVRLLYRRGADPCASDPSGATALQMADQYDYREIAEFLRNLPPRDSLMS